MQHRTTIPKYRWVVIGILTATESVNDSVIMLLGLLLPEISRDLDLSPAEQGILGSSPLFVALVLSIPVNNLVSRFRPWRVVSISFVAFAGFTVLQGLSPDFWTMIMGRTGMGLSFIIFAGPCAMLVQQWSVRGRQGVTNGVRFLGSDLVLSGVFFITPFMLSWMDSWRGVLYLWSGISLALSIFWIVFGRENITDVYEEEMASQEETPLRSILKYRALWIIGFGLAAGFLVEIAFGVFWPTFAQEVRGISTVVIGITLGLTFLAAAPCELAATTVPLFVRHKYWVIAVCGLGSCAVHLALLYTGSTPLLLGLAAGRGVSFSFAPILYTMVFQLPGIRPREIAVATAFVETLSLLGDVIGPLLVGFLQEATGDLKLSLFVITFAPLVLIPAGLLLWGLGNSYQDTLEPRSSQSPEAG